jgi:hypothetical protein
LVSLDELAVAHKGEWTEFERQLYEAGSKEIEQLRAEREHLWKTIANLMMKKP